jgi:hypothetical protein
MKKFLILMLVLFAGCYTIIKHPSIDYTDSSGEVYTLHVSYRSDCASCHSSSELFYFYSFIPSHNSSPWAYYNMPWWFQWGDNLTNANQTTVGGSSQEEKVRDFGVHRDSNTNSSFTPPTPTRSPSNSENNANSSSSGSMGKNSKNGENRDSTQSRTSNDSSSSQDKDESKDGKRNIGSRRR